MGRKQRSAKAEEKRREKQELERLARERVQCVREANAQKDPLEALPSFKASKIPLYIDN